MISEATQMLSEHLPESEKQPFLELIQHMCQQSMCIGRIKQVMENINVLKRHHNEENDKGEGETTTAQKESSDGPGTFGDTVLYGYSEDQGIF
jgi:hypothetical protein